jgi:hypothetical protein
MRPAKANYSGAVVLAEAVLRQWQAGIRQPIAPFQKENGVGGGGLSLATLDPDPQSRQGVEVYHVAVSAVPRLQDTPASIRCCNYREK